MPKRQTRRSISVKGLTYQWMKDYCDEQGMSVSGYVEELVAEDLKRKKRPKPTILRHEPKKKKKEEKEEKEDPPWGAHFTF